MNRVEEPAAMRVPASPIRWTHPATLSRKVTADESDDVGDDIGQICGKVCAVGAEASSKGMVGRLPDRGEVADDSRQRSQGHSSV